MQLRESQIVICTYWKRWKDKSHITELKQRRKQEWAVVILQKHYRYNCLQPDIFQLLVKYFCTDSETTARRWQLARWLTALAHSLPSESPLCRDWPRAPPGTNMKETSFLLRKLYHKWRVGQ